MALARSYYRRAQNTVGRKYLHLTPKIQLPCPGYACELQLQGNFIHGRLWALCDTFPRQHARSVI